MAGIQKIILLNGITSEWTYSIEVCCTSFQLSVDILVGYFKLNMALGVVLSIGIKLLKDKLAHTATHFPPMI